MHRRKSSKEDTDDGETFVLVSPPDVSTVVPVLTAPPNSSRHRSHPQMAPALSQPLLPLTPVPSPSAPQPPARRPPSISLNSPPTSPSFRTSHARVRSISSGPFIPPVSSPLATNFHVPLHPFEPGSSLPESRESINETSGPVHAQHGRRHSRLHSRNISVIFPRPHATISEDIVSDVESVIFPSNNHSHSQISSSQSAEPLQVGHDIPPSFSFGSSGKDIMQRSSLAGGGGMSTRRGHHHKHSLSHNFFSFLDPSARPEIRSGELHTASTPTPTSPWSPVSNLQGPGSTSSTMIDLTTGTSSRSDSKSPSPLPSPLSYTQPLTSPLYWNPSKDGLVARVVCVLQFCLGALVWVRGQAIGSLACTGLGYWVVFDAFGIAVGGPLVGEGKGGFFPARTQTTLLFAQCVYLMFGGVYVAKEAIEHILLSGGHSHSNSHSQSPASASLNRGTMLGLGLYGAGEMGSDGHHHHWRDDRPETLGLSYPFGLTILVLLSLLATSIAFEQHDVLVRVTNKYIHIPSPLSLLERSRSSHSTPSRGHGTWERILRNPYALPPIVFCLAILGAEMTLDVSHYTSFDLCLATLQVIITTHVAYVACVQLGGVLLQTAPASSFGKSMGKGANAIAKGVSTGLEANMEAFWRVMREIERHEHVVSLPAPHVWQVCPPGQSSLGQGNETQRRQEYPLSRTALSPSDAVLSPSDKRMSSMPPLLIITLSPHVSSSLPDEEVLKLTRWATERVGKAFTTDGQRGISGRGVEVEVCVGILRE